MIELIKKTFPKKIKPDSIKNRETQGIIIKANNNKSSSMSIKMNQIKIQ